MNNSQTLLETTLIMLGAQQYINEFKKFGIDSSILPLLTDDDLKVIGIEDEQLRSKLIKQCSNLPLLSDDRINLTVNNAYLMTVLNEIDHHLLLLDASLSYALHHKNIKRCDIQLHKASKTLSHCSDSFQKEVRSFHRFFSPKVTRKSNKWKLIILALLSATTSIYTLRKFFSR